MVNFNTGLGDVFVMYQQLQAVVFKAHPPVGWFDSCRRLRIGERTNSSNEQEAESYKEIGGSFRIQFIWF